MSTEECLLHSGPSLTGHRVVEHFRFQSTAMIGDSPFSFLEEGRREALFASLVPHLSSIIVVLSLPLSHELGAFQIKKKTHPVTICKSLQHLS